MENTAPPLLRRQVCLSGFPSSSNTYEHVKMHYVSFIFDFFPKLINENFKFLPEKAVPGSTFDILELVSSEG